MVRLALTFLLGFIGHSLRRLIFGMTESDNIRELAMEASGTVIVIGCGAMLFDEIVSPQRRATWLDFLAAGALSAIATGLGVFTARLLGFGE